ncbi:MAG TPA: hypothetical protein VN372_10910 [Methanospirillum sp.]|nr:hypothetical protein [Methanospirillum sp.]
MHWKNPLRVKSPAADNQPDTFYSLLKRETGEIRKQGEPPVRDAESFSRFSCDLCHRSAQISELRQCVICGRWACSDCWNPDYYVCGSCSGIIRLHKVSLPEFFITGRAGAPGDSSLDESAPQQREQDIH